MLLQDPVTGTCYDDIVTIDTTLWQWTTLQVATNVVKQLIVHVICEQTMFTASVVRSRLACVSDHCILQYYKQDLAALSNTYQDIAPSHLTLTANCNGAGIRRQAPCSALTQYRPGAEEHAGWLSISHLSVHDALYVCCVQAVPAIICTFAP